MNLAVPLLLALAAAAGAQSPAPKASPVSASPSVAASPIATVSGFGANPGVLVPAVGARTGRQVYDAECVQCHGPAGNGLGIAAPYLPVRPRDFTAKRFKLRSTASGQLPTRADLLDTVTRGIRPHAMPAFDFLNEAERKAVVEQVLAFAGAAEKPDPKPLDVGAEPAASPERVDQGKALYDKVQCGKCHQPNADDQVRPDLTDEAGHAIHPPHLQYDEFLGPDAPRDLALRLATGLDGTPMPSFAGPLSPDDVWSLALWIKSMREPRDPLLFTNRSRDPVIRAGGLVERFRCKACHVLGGEGGTLGPSLDSSGAKLRVEWIRAWLADPRAHGKIFNDRFVRMPNLHLSAREVEDLTAYVLSRGQRSPKESAPYIVTPTPAALIAGETRYRVMCTRCHALGNLIPAALAAPSGPDLIRMVERLYYPWLQGAIISERTTPSQVLESRDFLWKICSEKGPKPPAAPRAP